MSYKSFTFIEYFSHKKSLILMKLNMVFSIEDRKYFAQKRIKKPPKIRYKSSTIKVKQKFISRYTKIQGGFIQMQNKGTVTKKA